MFCKQQCEVCRPHPVGWLCDRGTSNDVKVLRPPGHAYACCYQLRIHKCLPVGFLINRHPYTANDIL